MIHYCERFDTEQGAKEFFNQVMYNCPTEGFSTYLTMTHYPEENYWLVHGSRRDSCE